MPAQLHGLPVCHPRQTNQRSHWASVNAKFSILVNFQHADRRFCALNRNTTIILDRHLGKRISQPLIEVESPRMPIPSHRSGRADGFAFSKASASSTTSEESLVPAA